MFTVPVQKKEHTVGIISDTHGLLRDEAVNALRGSDVIVHAGDIGETAVIDGLQAVAPVVAVRGNMDRDDTARRFPLVDMIDVHEVLLYVIHDIGRLDLDPGAAGMKAVIFGHSHRPLIEKHDGILYLNPGSAGPKRFRLPVSVALLHVRGKKLEAKILPLKV